MVNDLKEVIGKWKRRPFEWGKSDCSDFAGDAVRAMSGKTAIDPGEFSHLANEKFHKTISGHGFGLMIAKRLRDLGFQRVDNLVKPAICTINLGRQRTALGVFDGETLWMTGPNGIMAVEPWDALKFWTFNH